jgi:RNA polymerase sigma-70 factor (ECF subfamily)
MLPKPASPGDAEILAAVRALQGGAAPAAFEVIYRRFYPAIRAFFANRPALREQAHDLAQETLLRAYQKIGLFRSEEGSGFAAWLRTIAETIWKNARRAGLAAKRVPPGEETPEPLAEDSARAATIASSRRPAIARDQAPDPEAAVLAGERTRRLREAIEQLPPGMRHCTELRLFADLEYHEIAAVTGIGLNSVRSQLFEARQRLKAILADYFQGAEI